MRPREIYKETNMNRYRIRTAARARAVSTASTPITFALKGKQMEKENLIKNREEVQN